MASHLKNLSGYDKNKIPSGKGMKIGIVVSEWNDEITEKLKDAAVTTLTENGVNKQDIFINYVPGSFELPLSAKYLIKYTDVDAVICIGCVIQGETRHFDFICEAVSNGIMNLALETHIPVVFGVLTTNNIDQSKERAGGKHGNKGVEAAVTAIKMIALKKKLKN